MSGLGIVLEEVEPPVSLRALLVSPLPQMAPQPHSSAPSFAESESLLPPLPDDAAATVPRTATTSPLGVPSRLHFQLTGSPVASNIEFVDDSQLSQLTSHVTDVLLPQEPRSVLSELFSDHLLYELDSLALNQSTNISFPPVEQLSLASNSVNLHQPPSLTSGSSGLNTSPLRRLKSLKKGIRKLSLLKIASLLSSSTPVVSETAVAPRPVLSPMHTNLSQDASLLSSAGDSLRSSMFSVLAAAGVPTTAGSTPQGPGHPLATHGVLAKVRRRTLSGSHSSLTGTTPPLPLPIITLSENLTSTKETMVDVEQNFFENIGSGATSDSDNLGKLTTSEELMEYSAYLNEHKKTVVRAYDATHERLNSSGWVSNHDLENLSLQRDSSLSQIDTKLLQIEAKLNLEFQLLMLSNRTLPVPRGKTLSNSMREASLSPSLKVLESRCFAFVGSEVEMR